ERQPLFLKFIYPQNAPLGHGIRDAGYWKLDTGC
ncbi:MAG: hypothetical protein JWM28_3874, partial [Chitinophagaceae bacterium]|nr:hypothetical protein [Chitinophagaceae bacterium]